MKLDEVITKRFNELLQRADEILNAKQQRINGWNDQPYFAIPYAAFVGWQTNVLSLIKHAMGDDRVHFQNLTVMGDRFLEDLTEFENCKSVFQAAKDDYEGGYLFTVRGLS